MLLPGSNHIIGFDNNIEHNSYLPEPAGRLRYWGAYLVVPAVSVTLNVGGLGGR